MPQIPRSRAPALMMFCLLGAVTAQVPSAAAADPAATTTPVRGQRMQAVEAAHGAPSQRYPAVGRPPISRWDYPGFIVFFENDHVIHAVRLTPPGG